MIMEVGKTYPNFSKMQLKKSKKRNTMATGQQKFNINNNTKGNFLHCLSGFRRECRGVSPAGTKTHPFFKLPLQSLVVPAFWVGFSPRSLLDKQPVVVYRAEIWGLASRSFDLFPEFRKEFVYVNYYNE